MKVIKMNKDIKNLTKAIGYCILLIVVLSIIKMNVYFDIVEVDWFFQKITTFSIWGVMIIMFNNYFSMLVITGIVKSQFKTRNSQHKS